MPVWLRGFANLLDQAGISLCGNGFAYIFYISHRQHPGVIRSAAVAYTDMFLTEYIILAIHLNSQGALPDMVLNKVKENANLMV